MQDFRVIDLPERTTLDASDYTMIDSAENGTNKYLLSRQAAETDAKIAAAVGGVEEDLNAAVEGIEENITALQGDVETVETTLGTKADTDGTYPDMAVGSVLGTNTVTDREPYFLRPSASIGDREFDTLVGGSLGWNQLLVPQSKSETAGVVIVKNEDDSMTISGTLTGKWDLLDSTQLSKNGHVYYVDKGSDNTNYAINNDNSGVNTTTAVRRIVGKATADKGFFLYFPTTGIEINVTCKPMIIDLTTTFGSTIADYIYSLETAHAGDGVAWVKKYLPNDYYAYCAPTLKHVTGVSAHVLTGFNQFDVATQLVDGVHINNTTGEAVSGANRASTDYVPVIGGEAYYINTPQTGGAWGAWYDSDKQYISGITGYAVGEAGRLQTAPDNARYMRLTLVYNSIGDPNAVCINLSDASKNGTYEPYEKHSYPLDSTWTGMGIPKLDSDGKLYFDGDRYSADGTVTERCGIRAYQSGDESLADAITDGTNTVYKLTTPTTSSASPFTSPQICDPNGTEEYVTTGLVPVGHETEYVENLADKLTDIPDLPTTAGTYSLKVTVSGGVPSYSWVNA